MEHFLASFDMSCFSLFYHWLWSFSVVVNFCLKFLSNNLNLKSHSKYPTCFSHPTECNCPKGPENLYGFCDINTGECCKPGGDCEICPTNYILTPQGCVYCGECVGRLLNKATILDYNLTTVLKSLEQGAAGLVAENRFTDINETLQR